MQLLKGVLLGVGISFLLVAGYLLLIVRPLLRAARRSGTSMGLMAIVGPIVMSPVFWGIGLAVVSLGFISIWYLK